MPRRAFLRDRVDQPQVPTGVDFGNPITRGAVFASFAGLPSLGPHPSAPRVARRGVFASERPSGAWYSAPIRPVTSADWTLISLAYTPDISGLVQTSWGLYGDGNNFVMQTHRTWMGTNAGYDVRPQGGNTPSATAFPTNRLCLHISRIDTRTTTGTHWIDGVRSQSGLASTSPATVNAVNFFAKNGGDTASVGTGIALAYAAARSMSDAEVASIISNPWQLAAPVERVLNPSLTVTAFFPGSDIAVSGWSAVGAASVAAAMADPSQANYAEVVPGTNGVCTWLSPVPAGSIDLTLTLRRVGTQGEVRLVLLNAGGSEVGASAWQPAPLAAFGDVNFLSVAVSATSTQFRIETRP
jgi:hypothetical protein